MLNYYGQQYVYQVYEKNVVAPTDVSVLGPASQPATVTLITCDPPGVSVHRLTIVAEQISPAPAGNSATPAVKYSQAPKIIPSNPESLLQRLFGWL
jgi:sortase A